MTKDYAKKRTSSTRKKTGSRTKQRPVQKKQSLRWLVAGLLIGLFIAGLTYIYQHPQHTKKKQPQIATKKPTPHKKKVKAPQKPHFDFYTILPKMKVWTPETEAKKDSKQKAKETYYILQVASFQRYRDADHLKARLTLLGYDVNIQPIEHNNKKWNRVFIGPYSAEDAAKKAQQGLRKQHVKSILVKLDKQG